MDNFGPLIGSDISRHLTSPRSFGVTSCSAPDGVPTVELTTDPSGQGAHGTVSVRCSELNDTLFCARPGGAGADVALRGDASLTAVVRLPNRGMARCRSNDSIRIWGGFGPGAELVVGSANAVRVVVRTLSGDVLAGPIAVSANDPQTTLAW